MLEHTQLIADESAGARKILRLQSQSDSVHAIQREVARHFGIQVEDITGPSRTQKYCIPRHIALWLCRELVKRENGKPVSLPILGNLFGGRDHTTILIALRKMKKEVEEGGEIAKTVLALSVIVQVAQNFAYIWKLENQNQILQGGLDKVSKITPVSWR